MAIKKLRSIKMIDTYRFEYFEVGKSLEKYQYGILLDEQRKDVKIESINYVKEEHSFDILMEDGVSLSVPFQYYIAISQK